MRPAIFLDRDGTLVHARHYPSTPAELILYEGIGDAIFHLQQQAGYALVIVTNQSGIARGYFGQRDLAAMHNDLRARLEAAGARVDGIYYCPHHVDGVVPEFAIECGCRKPEPGMLVSAASDLDLELAGSWMIGDILDDVQAGKRAGCRTVLVDLGTEDYPHCADRRPDFVARDTLHALRIVAAESGVVADADRCYVPSSWRAAPASIGT